MGLFLDFSKAVHTINHCVLVEKRNVYEFEARTYSLLRTFLQERDKIIRTKNSVSDETIINTGVPQGSILGPLLFLINITDLPDSLTHSDYVPYTDDTNLLIAGGNIQTLYSKLSEYSKNLILCTRAMA